MQQYNLITDPQAQIVYKVSQAQISTKRKDYRQMEKLKPYLKQLQQNSAKLLKDYHEYLSNKERKASGLPYHMIKKFEILQSNLHDTTKILTNQCRQFEVEVAARDFQKDNQQLFFKKTMKSYDQRRIWLKNYILKNEQKMQIVEEEVKKNIDYQTHKFTKYISEVDLQRLQHNYQPKMEAEIQLLQTIRRNARLKDTIRQKLTKQKQRIIKSQENKQNQKVQQQMQKIKKLEYQGKSLHSFLYSYFVQKTIQNTFLISELKKLKTQKGLLSHQGQQLKLAIDIQSQKLEDYKFQWSIIQNSYKNNRSKLWEDKIFNIHNYTKTDYFIYLREINRRVQHKIKSQGLYFQYMLLLPDICMYKRTKSASKEYKISKPSQKLSISQNKKMKQYLNQYLQKEKHNIQASKKQRQRKRQQQKQQIYKLVDKSIQIQKPCNNHSNLLKQLEDTPKKQTELQKQILNQLQEESFKQIEQNEI